ncbi:hypothetical protein BH09MYX1_BH09MYX1_28430 [soil metagenome]
MRSVLIRLGVLSSLVVVACGGGGASGTKPKDGSNAVDPDHMSIGDVAAQQGGLGTLGGNGNTQGSGIGGSLRFDLVEKDAKVLLDGILKEWPSRAAATTVVKGSADKVSASFAIQYDDAKVWVGGEVNDEKLTRTARFGEDEDHASLIVATPATGVQTGSYTTVELGLYAGKPGESAGAVRYLSGPNKGRDVPGAKIVEAPTEKGYSFEVQLPWSVVAPSGVHLGLRGAMRYYDGGEGGGGIKSILATGPGDAASAASLAFLPSESEQSLVEGFLSPKGLLATAPKVDIIADVIGDAQKERITVYDRYITVLGPGYRGGKEFFFRDLGADLVKLETKDVTGRGKEDLLLRRRFPGTSTREWFEVWSFLGDEPSTTFAHEIAITMPGKQVTNAIRASSKEIEITYEPAQGWDVTTYREATASDVEPVLLPWGAIKSQLYRYDNGKFAKLKEVSQTPQPGAAVAAYTVSQKPPEPPTPTVHTNTDLGKSILDKFKTDRGIAASDKPRFDVEVHVDGDSRPERVVVFGRDICVFGPGFKNGTAYAFITLSQFAADADVKDIAVRDMTGDGAADLTVRGVRHVTAAGQGNVDMDMLFIYQVKSEAITRVFGIETGREQTGKRVQGMVQFIPAAGGKGFDVDVSPGRATGWTDKTYPWGQDQPGAGAVEPLLLPWGGIAHLKYSWNGTTFAKSP